MPNLQQMKSTALTTIDAALAILNKYPNINSSNSELSFNTSSNPFPMLMDAFKSTAGYNILIRILSKFLLVGLPPMELAVKSVLLASIKNILSCSINPFISRKILMEGIVFNLEQIDLTDTLKYCPTSQNGQYHYFDIKDEATYSDNTISKPDLDDEGGVFKLPDELKNSKDFNCLLWYMKNRASFREVWGKKNSNNNKPFEQNDDYYNADSKKCRKGAGIITLEYNERPQSITNAEGGGLGIQTPYNNCIHVFLGNVKEKSNENIINLDNRVKQLSKELQTYNQEINNILTTIEGYQKKEVKLNKQLQQGKITLTEYKSNVFDKIDLLDLYEVVGQMHDNLMSEEQYNSIIPRFVDTDALLSLLQQAWSFVQKRTQCIQERVNAIKSQRAEKLTYRDIEENYYYNHTLVEFNTDYVMSLRLFDTKVITAQLIDAMTGLLNIDLHLSYKQQLIKSEIKKMIDMVVTTDDTVVDDCFFTFTNDDYNAMLGKAELNRMGLFSLNGESNTETSINADELLANLNEINDSAVQSGDTTVIENILTTISKDLATTEDKVKKTTGINYGVQMNFIENLMNNLAYVISYAVLSPKVYLLILINLQIMGQETNFNIQEFIGKYKQLIANILRSVRDQLLKYLTDELYKLLGDIATEVAVKIGVEQMEYYKRLMKQIMECFKLQRSRNNLDFNIDDVDYADILAEETVEKPKKC